MAGGSHEGLAVAKNAVDFDFIGIMTEALCAETYKSVLPAYYDVCLKTRYSSSPEDAEMIELCVNSRIFDFGYVYDNWEGAAFLFQELLELDESELSSYYASQSKAYTKYYDSVLQRFTDYNGIN